MGAGLLCAAPSNQDVYGRTIIELGGRPANAMTYPQTVAGFQSYLTACGVTTISAAEMTHPNHPEVAVRHGYHDFLPPQTWWSRGAALGLLTQKLEAVVGNQIHLRNWWRPAAYNNDPVVGGAKDGDHPSATAIDLDYRSVGDRMRAEAFLRSLARRDGWMQLSLGLGAQTTHVGIGSPRGHREWHYAGWRPVAAGVAAD